MQVALRGAKGNRPTSMVFALHSGVQLVVHDHEPPLAGDWRRYLEHTERSATEIRAILTYTDGGVPQASQRQSVLRWCDDIPTAIVSPRLAVRTLATSVHALAGRPVAAFAPPDLPHALSYLGIVRAERDGIVTRLVDLVLLLESLRAAN
jgi:hypothetical protein